MDEHKRSEIRRFGDWLSGEVEIRLSRKILAMAGVVLLALIALALD